MSVTLGDVGTVVLYLGALATAITMIGGLVRVVVVGPLKRWIVEQIADVRETTHAVAAEVTSNGGSSLKDKLTDMVTLLGDVQHRVNHHLDREVPQMRAELAVLRDRLDRLERDRKHEGNT